MPRLLPSTAILGRVPGPSTAELFPNQSFIAAMDPPGAIGLMIMDMPFGSLLTYYLIVSGLIQSSYADGVSCVNIVRHKIYRAEPSFM